MKVQTALRFDKALLDLIREKAAAERRSLNNYIEFLLYREVGDIPNELTKNALDEANNNSKLEPIQDLNQFLDEL